MVDTTVRAADSTVITVRVRERLCVVLRTAIASGLSVAVGLRAAFADGPVWVRPLLVMIMILMMMMMVQPF